MHFSLVNREHGLSETQFPALNLLPVSETFTQFSSVEIVLSTLHSGCKKQWTSVFPKYFMLWNVTNPLKKWFHEHKSFVGICSIPCSLRSSHCVLRRWTLRTSLVKKFALLYSALYFSDKTSLFFLPLPCSHYRKSATWFSLVLFPGKWFWKYSA